MNIELVLYKLPPLASNIIIRMASIIWSFPEVMRVVLYGSYAKLTHTEDSDIDIAVFVEDEYYGKTLFKQIVKACTITELDVQVQLFPLSDLNFPCGIIEEILESGIDLPRELTSESDK